MTKACRRAHDEVCRVQQKAHQLFPSTDENENREMVNGGCDVVLTHPETGILFVHFCMLKTLKKPFSIKR